MGKGEPPFSPLLLSPSTFLSGEASSPSTLLWLACGGLRRLRGKRMQREKMAWGGRVRAWGEEGEGRLSWPSRPSRMGVAPALCAAAAAAAAAARAAAAHAISGIHHSRHCSSCLDLPLSPQPIG